MSEEDAGKVIDLLHRQHSESMRAHDRTARLLEELTLRVGQVEQGLALIMMQCSIPQCKQYQGMYGTRLTEMP